MKISTMRCVGVATVLAGLLAQQGCATTRETVQECKQAARSFCDQTVGANAPGTAYRDCLETQTGACGAIR